MKKILVTAAAAIISAVAITASTAPASAGNFNFTLGVGGWGSGWHPGYGGGIYVNPYPVSNWAAHVDWCYSNKGPSYNPHTNKYVNYKGQHRTCHSPFA